MQITKIITIIIIKIDFNSLIINHLYVLVQALPIQEGTINSKSDGSFTKAANNPTSPIMAIILKTKR